MSGQLRCSNCGGYDVKRDMGFGAFLAGITSFLVIGLPFFIYAMMRDDHVGDQMYCGLCGYRFILTAQHLGLPARSAITARATTSGGGLGKTLLIGTVVVAAAVTLLIVLGPAISSANRPSTPAQLALPTTTPTPSQQWVRNQQLTEMWSGPSNDRAAISFGRTSAQLCVFLVVRPRDDSRLYVLNPYSDNYFWIDASAVVPTEPPERRPAQKPAGQNCSVYDVR